MIDGLMVTNEYLIGGFYSSDGWTCTPRGNAIIAYRTIEAINKKYDTSIPLPNIHAYEDMKFPR